MDRSSSRRSLRSERIANSPYKRPIPEKTTSPLSTLRSIYSYVASSFSRPNAILPTSTDGRELDQKSESGSEDNWDGSAPNNMDGQDVFSLAAAGGREGPEFEDRAASWRAQGEKAGGRRDMARRALEPFSSLEVQPRTPMMPGLSLGLRPTTSMSGFPIASSSKRPLATPTHAPSQAPMPSFLPPALQPHPSASSAALAAFLEAKHGQQMTPEDFRVMETLMASMKTESNSPPRKEEEVLFGGWSAGKATPRSIKALPSAVTATPRASTPLTPTHASFSLGKNDSPVASPSSRRITYLGPGMSPRRMLPKPRGSARLLFDEEVEESEPKRRRVEETSIDPAQPTVTDTTTASPAQTAVKAMPLNAPHKPSPLGPTAATVSADVITEGKRRAADIMKELIEEEIGPLQPAEPNFMIINPYDKGAGSTSISPRSVTKTSTPLKSLLRSSLRSSSNTPPRGAAAKLEAHKSGRKLTTLEILQGKRPWTGPPRRVHIETPTKEREEAEVNAMFDEEMVSAPEVSPAQPPSPAKASIKIPEPDVLPRFAVPVLDTPTRPTPSFTPKPPTADSFASPSQEAVIAAAQQTQTTPKFTPSAQTPIPLPDSLEATNVNPPKQESTRTKLSNPTALFHSARDLALTMAKGVLPFYTFTSPSMTTVKIDESVKRAALDRPLEVFTFTLTPASPPAVPAKPATPWTCDLCMLQNPATASEKCTICEAPKPAR